MPSLGSVQALCPCCPPGRAQHGGAPVGRRRALGLLIGTAVAPLTAGCDEQDGFPIRLVSDETVQQLGLETWQRLRAEVPASDDRGLQRALQESGGRLLAAAGEDPAGWEMLVFATPEVNAFVLPGGKIGVFEGMFRAAATADQLAAVIGHEIGHHQAEHSKERLSAAAAKHWGLRLISAALQLGDVEYANEIAALLGVGAEFGLLLPYSRRQELEADRLGLFTMARAGFDPRAAIELWRRMDRLGGQRGPAFLSTHPAPEARFEAREGALPEAMRAVETAS